MNELFVLVCLLVLLSQEVYAFSPFVVKLYQIKNCDTETTSKIIKQTSLVNAIECSAFRYFYESSGYAPGVIECGIIPDYHTLGYAKSTTPNQPAFEIRLDLDKIKRFNISVENVILHELGHTLGLEHNTVEPTSVMTPKLYGLEPANFSFYDIKKIQEIHPLCMHRDPPLNPFLPPYPFYVPGFYG